MSLVKGQWYDFIRGEDSDDLDTLIANTQDPAAKSILEQVRAGLVYSKKGVLYFTAGTFEGLNDVENDIYVKEILNGAGIRTYSGPYIWSVQGVIGLTD